jgi:Zn ribbon nucleic-acid-binding protein
MQHEAPRIADAAADDPGAAVPSTASAVTSTLHTSRGTSQARASTAVPSCATFVSTTGEIREDSIRRTSCIACRAHAKRRDRHVVERERARPRERAGIVELRQRFDAVSRAHVSAVDRALQLEKRTLFPGDAACAPSTGESHVRDHGV